LEGSWPIQGRRFPVKKIDPKPHCCSETFKKRGQESKAMSEKESWHERGERIFCGKKKSVPSNNLFLKRGGGIRSGVGVKLGIVLQEAHL